MSKFVFRPVILGPVHRWKATIFELKFDAKWTNQPGSIVNMTSDETITVKVVDRPNPMSGMRFSTGSEWVAVASGQNFRISLTTKSHGKPCAYRTAYIPQDVPHSGFYFAHANAKPSTFSFDFALSEGSKSKTHFIVVEPQLDNVMIEIIDAKIEVICS